MAEQLITAAQSGDIKQLEKFDFKQIDINTVDELGRTALLRAASRGHREVAECLIQNGADTNKAESVNGFTPLMAASENNHKEVVHLLLYYGASADKVNAQGIAALHLASRNNNCDIIILLLRCDADVNIVNQDKITPLHLACNNGYYEVVEILLENGADVNIADDKGITPFQLAREKKNSHLLQILYQYGADMKWKDLFTGKTPLFVVKDVVKLSREAVGELIEEGCEGKGVFMKVSKVIKPNDSDIEDYNKRAEAFNGAKQCLRELESYSYKHWLINVNREILEDNLELSRLLLDHLVCQKLITIDDLIKVEKQENNVQKVRVLLQSVDNTLYTGPRELVDAFIAVLFSHEESENLAGALVTAESIINGQDNNHSESVATTPEEDLVQRVHQVVVDQSRVVCQELYQCTDKLAKQSHDQNLALGQELYHCTDKLAKQSHDQNLALGQELHHCTDKLEKQSHDQNQALGQKVDHGTTRILGQMCDNVEAISQKIEDESDYVRTKVHDASVSMKNQFQTGVEESKRTQIQLAGNVSNLNLECQQPLLRTFQEKLEDNLNVNDELMGLLKETDVIDEREAAVVMSESDKMGKAKRLLVLIDSDEERVNSFINRLTLCNCGINKALGETMSQN